MYNFDFVFSDEQYKLLNSAYKSVFTPNLSHTVTTLSNIISLLEIYGFGLPLNTQNSTRNLLIQSSEILNILHSPQHTTRHHIDNNPFALIHTLSQIAIDLNRFQPKAPYQIIAAKANNLILQAIVKISKQLQN